jgi:hypothetical protein
VAEIRGEGVMLNGPADVEQHRYMAPSRLAAELALSHVRGTTVDHVCAYA